MPLVILFSHELHRYSKMSLAFSIRYFRWLPVYFLPSSSRENEQDIVCGPAIKVFSIFQQYVQICFIFQCLVASPTLQEKRADMAYLRILERKLPYQGKIQKKQERRTMPKTTIFLGILLCCILSAGQTFALSDAEYNSLAKNSSEFRQADKELNKFWKITIGQLDGDYKSKVLNEQRQWVKN